MSQLESTVRFIEIIFRFRALEKIIVAQQFKIFSSCLNLRHNVFFHSNPVLKPWNLADSFTHSLTLLYDSQMYFYVWEGVSSFRSFSGAFAKLRKAIGRIFMKFEIDVFFENLSRKFKFIYTWREKWVLYMKTNVGLWPYLSHSSEISPTRCNNCVLFFAMALLYMFRATISLIIRSTYAVYGHW